MAYRILWFWAMFRRRNLPAWLGVSGYVQRYAANNFTFATLRDAGHMAPRYRPAAALHMFRRFLTDLPM